MYCPSFPEAPTMHTLMSSSHQWTGTQVGLHSGHDTRKRTLASPRLSGADPRSSGVSEGLPAFVSSFTVLRLQEKGSAQAPPSSRVCAPSVRPRVATTGNAHAETAHLQRLLEAL